MKVIAIVNQKGGVGKTTTAVNLSCGLAKKGYRVLAIDLDQQGHLTKSLGIDVKEMGIVNTASKWLMNSLPLDDVIVTVHGIDVVPADITLASLELKLQQELIDREYTLGKEISKVADRYDYVIVDSSPSFNIITINILTAADRVILPLCPDFLSKDGGYKLLESIEQIQKRINPKLKLTGFLPTLVDKRCNNAASFAEAEQLTKQYGGVVFGEGIRLASVLRKAPEHGMSIFDYDPNSAAAKDYQAFVDKFVEIEGEER